MSAPKHLWSGDWEGDSEAAARERARQRPELPTPAEEAPPARPQPTPLQRADQPGRTQTAPPRPKRTPRKLPRAKPATVAVVAIVALALVAAAFGIAQIGGSGGSTVAAKAKNLPYLGVNMETLPINRVMIAAVTPGSPADRAGLGPGDVITAIDSKPVEAPGDVTAVISHLHPGDSVSLGIQRGGLNYSTRAMLTAQPPNYP
jgi:S1-C subfamily serine protease